MKVPEGTVEYKSTDDAPELLAPPLVRASPSRFLRATPEWQPHGRAGGAACAG